MMINSTLFSIKNDQESRTKNNCCNRLNPFGDKNRSLNIVSLVSQLKLTFQNETSDTMFVFEEFKC